MAYVLVGDAVMVVSLRRSPGVLFVVADSLEGLVMESEGDGPTLSPSVTVSNFIRNSTPFRFKDIYGSSGDLTFKIFFPTE